MYSGCVKCNNMCDSYLILVAKTLEEVTKVIAVWSDFKSGDSSSGIGRLW